MSTAHTTLRAAIFTALTNDAALTAQLGTSKIFDEVPRNATMPYVVLSDARITDRSTSTSQAIEHTITINAWSQQGGHREASDITATILQTLDNTPLTLTGHTLINLRFATADIRRTPDGRSYLAQIRFRAMTEEL